MIKKNQMLDNIKTLIEEKGEPVKLYINTNDERNGKYGTVKYDNDVCLMFKDGKEVIVNNAFYYSTAEHIVNSILKIM